MTFDARTCPQCGALVAAGHREVHRLWHQKVEPGLETPSSEFGFWDHEGRWNVNSEDW